MSNTPHSSKPVAILWDEAHLWGLLVIRALKALQIPLVVMRAVQIKDQGLESLKPASLVVPGGWARLKSQALGSQGRQAIGNYIAQGGQYLGFCGGAGLGLASEQHTPCLDLCSWSRKSTSERLPNFSGHLYCQLTQNQHSQEALLPVWWPSQFLADPAAPLEVLASYLRPGPDFWSADLYWAGIAEQEIQHWEQLYAINLNPKALVHEPCIVRGTLGRGSFVLSYPHLETPDSPQANTLMAQLLGQQTSKDPVPQWHLHHENPLWTDQRLEKMSALLWEIISFGQQHFLLFWRTPWLLGWRRGVPGSALNFLLAMVWQARHSLPTPEAEQFWQQKGPLCLKLCQEFCAQSQQYLLQERRVLATSPSSPECSASPALQKHKKELFGNFPGYGGLYGQIITIVDELVWLQWSASREAKIVFN